MADRRLLVDLYCEDRGHEEFTRSLLQRLAAEEGAAVRLRTQNSLGGHGRAVSEFKLWQRKVVGGLPGRRPDLLVLVVDGNCTDWRTAHKDLSQVVDKSLFPQFVVGCPEPHVERWCFADPESFTEVIGAAPPPDPGKCERFLYKNLLRRTILGAGQPILTTEMEFAPDLVEAMALYRAGKNQRSLGHFVDGLRAALRLLA